MCLPYFMGRPSNLAMTIVNGQGLRLFKQREYNNKNIVTKGFKFFEKSLNIGSNWNKKWSTVKKMILKDFCQGKPGWDTGVL